jgi:hypothetical protein
MHLTRRNATVSQKFMDKEECKNFLVTIHNLSQHSSISMKFSSGSASNQGLCSVASFTNEDSKKVLPYVGLYLLIEACDRHNRSRRVWIQ